jgi:hypothetical protein
MPSGPPIRPAMSPRHPAPPGHGPQFTGNDEYGAQTLPEVVILGECRVSVHEVVAEHANDRSKVGVVDGDGEITVTVEVHVEDGHGTRCTVERQVDRRRA